MAEGADLIEVADSSGEREGAVMLGDDDGVGCEERAACEKFEDAVVFGCGGVGRVKEGVGELRQGIAATRGETLEPAESVER